MESDFKHYTLEELITAVATAECWGDVCRTLNVSVCTYNYKRLQKLCSLYEVDVQHFDARKAYRRNKFEWTAEKFFVECSTANRCQVRPLMIRFGMYTGICSECGIGDEWHGKPLTLEVDHINGNSSDNRKENLRWLCPNCHSQTSTYRRKSSE